MYASWIPVGSTLPATTNRPCRNAHEVMTGRLRIAYLSLEAPREGQASFTHVSEIVKGLRGSGWVVDLVAPFHSAARRRPSAIMRLLHFIPIQLHLMIRHRRYDLVYIRAHPVRLSRGTGGPPYFPTGGAGSKRDVHRPLCCLPLIAVSAQDLRLDAALAISACLQPRDRDSRIGGMAQVGNWHRSH